jgi:hypothetical protein
MQQQQIGTAGDAAVEQSITAGAGAESPAARTPRSIFLFWAPLAVQWLMMAAEGPFLAAVIARMGDAAVNLAAYGVAVAFAILTESPVIMLMSAATALVEDAESYRRLRNFAYALSLGATSLVLLVLVPPVFHLLTGVLGLPGPVASRVYGSLAFLLPWPAAIGYRRFLHGILIRSGRTRLVAYGTVLRLSGMAATALLLYHVFPLPGAWVGAIALSAGVVIEAVAARFMAAEEVARLSGAAGKARRRWGVWPRWPGRAAVAGYGDIARFYFPLALTSLIGLTVQPMLTFFMGRAPSPLESLAVFPVVHALSFLFRAPGLAFQEVVIALAGKRFEHLAPLRSFGIGLGLAVSAGLALVTLTPLAGFWFDVVSGLPPELATRAVGPAMLSVPLPALTVLLAFQLGILVQSRRTRAVTGASLLEVAGIAALFTLAGWRFGLFGASAAMIGLVGGRVIANGYLWTRVRRVLVASARPISFPS